LKTFRYAMGHEAGKTMTVVELRRKLKKYSKDMPVFGTWEGVCGYIEPEKFFVEDISKGYENDKCTCLLIDVERY